MDPAIVEGDETMMANIDSNINRPGAKFWTKEGALMAGGNNYILQVPEAHIPQDLFALNNLMFELSDKLSTMPAASEGRAESSKESGTLFRSKYEAGLIAQGDMYKSLELMWAEIADAYYRQARITYAGQNNRTFAGFKNGEGFTINESVPGPNGEKLIKNDISKLPRIQITIKPSEKGLNTRSNNRIAFSEVMHSLPRNMQIAPIAFMEGIVKTLDTSEGFQEEMEAIFELEKANAVSMIERNMAENALVAEQAKAQLKSMQQQGIAQQEQPLGGQPSPAMTGEEATNPNKQKALMMAGTPQEEALTRLSPELTEK